MSTCTMTADDNTIAITTIIIDIINCPFYSTLDVSHHVFYISLREITIVRYYAYYTYVVDNNNDGSDDDDDDSGGGGGDSDGGGGDSANLIYLVLVLLVLTIVYNQ